MLCRASAVHWRAHNAPPRDATPASLASPRRGTRPPGMDSGTPECSRGVCAGPPGSWRHAGSGALHPFRRGGHDGTRNASHAAVGLGGGPCGVLAFGSAQALAAPREPEQQDRCNSGQCMRTCQQMGYDGGRCFSGDCLCYTQIS